MRPLVPTLTASPSPEVVIQLCFFFPLTHPLLLSKLFRYRSYSHSPSSLRECVFLPGLRLFFPPFGHDGKFWESDPPFRILLVTRPPPSVPDSKGIITVTCQNSLFFPRGLFSPLRPVYFLLERPPNHPHDKVGRVLLQPKFTSPPTPKNVYSSLFLLPPTLTPCAQW